MRLLTLTMLIVATHASDWSISICSHQFHMCIHHHIVVENGKTCNTMQNTLAPSHTALAAREAACGSRGRDACMEPIESGRTMAHLDAMEPLIL